jgi:hypothetical protein
MVDMVTVPRLWPGETIVCIATGPSANQADADFVRGRARVIAINDAHRLAPWADVLYSSDRQWWRHYKGVPEFQGMRYGIGSGVGKRNVFTELPNVRVLLNTGYNGLETSPNGLRTGRNSGYAAINLAVHFGAARIVLMGYNLGYAAGKAHFFGDHPPNLTQRESLYVGFRQSFEHLVAPLAALGVEVINCTPETGLATFPVRPLRDVLVSRAA